MGITAAIVGTAAVVGGTTYQAVNANQQRIAGERAASKAQADQQQQMQDLEKQQKTQEQQASDTASAQAAQTALQQTARRKASAIGGSGDPGFGGTILTGPMGLQPSAGSPATLGGGGKTLLGS